MVKHKIIKQQFPSAINGMLIISQQICNYIRTTICLQVLTTIPDLELRPKQYQKHLVNMWNHFSSESMLVFEEGRMANIST